MAIIEQAVPLSGLSLNFEVVGDTVQPNNPKENTIWVNTATEITSWTFAAVAPASPTAGMVWVKTGAASDASFNALKKNEVAVYPMFAQQYINGAWENKTADIFQNDTWNRIEGDIYIIPNLVGFPATNWSSSNGGSFNAAGQLETGTIGYTDYYHRLLTPIDLTPYETIKFTFTYENNNVAYIGVAATNDALHSAWVAKTGGTPTTYSLDVSNLTGQYYIAMYGNSGGASVNRKWTVTALEVLL